MRHTSKEVAVQGIIPYLEKYSYPDEIIKSSNSHLPLLRALGERRKGRAGKEYRPQLLSCIGRSIYENLNTLDNCWEKIIPYLSAIELILTSTYLTDDIDDKQEERFGDESTWKKYGLSEAIFAAFRQREIAERIIIDKQNCSLENKIKILSLISDINRETYDGQTLNSKLIGNYNHEIYLKRCKFFGGVLGGYVGIGAAILANADKTNSDLIENLVINWGTAGMIRNDLKDYVTNDLLDSDLQASKALKRIPLEDFRIGRITYPLHIALNSEYKSQLESLIGKANLTPEEEKKVVFAVTNSGGLDKTIFLIEEYKQKALEYWEMLPENESKYILRDLINLMRNSRDYVNLIKSKLTSTLSS